VSATATDLLTINAGSTSLRIAAFRATRHGIAELGRGRLAVGPAASLTDLARTLEVATPHVIAHRVVHGGARLVSTCEIEAHVEREIASLSALAPLHNPVAVEWISAARRAWPSAMQVAVFDTAFFASLPEVATTYALPRTLTRKLGIRRYGFHGIAHRAIWRAWQRFTGRRGDGRLISFQLGGGSSVAAIEDGRPVETSMGMTPLEGLVMATRAGDVDPGVIFHALRDGGLSPRALERLLTEESGLRGLSGTSGDVRTLLAQDSADAALAIDVYCHRARKYLGAYLATLGGADAIAFAGGVGEHAPEIRARIAAGAAFCGLRLDEAANQRGVGSVPARISATGSAPEVWVIPLDEELAIAEEALAFSKGAA
jgi:acetate kinase